MGYIYRLLLSKLFNRKFPMIVHLTAVCYVIHLIEMQSLPGCAAREVSGDLGYDLRTTHNVDYLGGLLEFSFKIYISYWGR